MMLAHERRYVWQARVVRQQPNSPPDAAAGYRGFALSTPICMSMPVKS
jgi:hypothetical protein